MLRGKPGDIGFPSQSFERPFFLLHLYLLSAKLTIHSNYLHFPLKSSWIPHWKALLSALLSILGVYSSVLHGTHSILSDKAGYCTMSCFLLHIGAVQAGPCAAFETKFRLLWFQLCQLGAGAAEEVATRAFWGGLRGLKYSLFVASIQKTTVKFTKNSIQLSNPQSLILRMPSL